MGNSDKEGPRARLGHHAKAKTHGPWSGHPEPVGLDHEPRLAPNVPGHGQAPRDAARSLSVEKHEPRPLKCGRPSRGSCGTTLVMAGHDQATSEHDPNTWGACATDPVMEAVTEPGGNEGTSSKPAIALTTKRVVIYQVYGLMYARHVSRLVM
ncbi:hypothetical protein Sjap_019849 [Stephania japonica]|uniref:Uncharacterized protein n=1 Tax=Stephania japonica TaxID=461633 RepID=A0AAP0EZJ7_9MAGN